MWSPVSWWYRDVPYHAYIYTQFLIGLPFFIFNTYVLYQLQIVGYVIGTTETGEPCVTYCIVPFGNTHLDLNSALLYLNAIGFGLGGFMMIIIAAYSDYWKQKHILVTFFLVVYGAFGIPTYWLRDISQSSFTSLMGLYVAFAIATLVIIALLNIYIPHCMRKLEENNGNVDGTNDTIAENPESALKKKQERLGFNMSILGSIANYIAGVIMLVIVIILSRTLPMDQGQNAGLLMTTVIGCVTVAGCMVSYFGLPRIPSKPKERLTASWTAPILEVFAPFKDLLVRPSALLILISYTIYTDTTFALSSVVNQLFISEVHPGTLEFSLYTLAGTLLGFITSFLFYLSRFWWPAKLERCLILGYASILIIPVWGCIGISNSAKIGFKHRWEFYVQLVLFYGSQSIVNPSFRVLFSEMIPKGNEIRWFGLQLILSCATIWVNYVATGPLQNATHNLRFPLILCLVFFISPLVLEVLRSETRLVSKPNTEVLNGQIDHQQEKSQAKDVVASVEKVVS